MPGRAVHFIGGSIGSVGHLLVSFTVIIFAKMCMLIPMGVSDVTEWSAEENVGILTR